MMKGLSAILFILFLMISILGLSQTVSSGRLREKSNQKRLYKHIHQSGWSYRKTPTGKHKCYGNHLFVRKRPAVYYKRQKYQQRINRERALQRKRGNDYFQRRKYKFY